MQTPKFRSPELKWKPYTPLENMCDHSSLCRDGRRQRQEHPQELTCVSDTHAVTQMHTCTYNLRVCVQMYVWDVCAYVYVFRSQRKASNSLSLHLLLFEEGSLPELGVHIIFSRLATSNPLGSPSLPLFSPNTHMGIPRIIPGFLHEYWDLNSGSHVCMSILNNWAISPASKHFTGSFSQ